MNLKLHLKELLSDYSINELEQVVNDIKKKKFKKKKKKNSK